jgi:hypothetical protein
LDELQQLDPQRKTRTQRKTGTDIEHNIVRLVEKSWLKVLFADLLCEENTAE